VPARRPWWLAAYLAIAGCDDLGASAQVNDVAPSAAPSPADAGKAIFKSAGCEACHSKDGSPLVGPSMKGFWKRAQDRAIEFEGGKTLGDYLDKGEALPSAAKLTSVEDYVTLQLETPRVLVVKGFAPTAPSYEGRVNEGDLEALVAYLKTL